MSDAALALGILGAIVISLNAYVLLAGADFGGGVWDLFALGPRRDRQRALIADAIGPIWEANHVWLILVVVLLFTCFPAVFARLSVTLHIPLTLMLVGIVLRGSAFTFRSYDTQKDAVQRRWSLLFSWASLITPVLIGISVGTVAAGNIPARPSGTFADAYVTPWSGLFQLSIGFLALALFAFLAACYLAWEATDTELKDDFRRRALWAGVIVFATSLAALVLARDEAPRVWAGLLASPWALVLQALTAVAALTALGALWTRRWNLARMAAAAQVSLIVWGWAMAQFPYLLPPELHYAEAAAPRRTLQLVLGALTAGAIVLFPSLWYLFRIFKSR